VVINRMKVNGRDISNFVYNGTDSAGLYTWYTTVPKLNAKDRIKVHILANKPSTGTCRPATTCQESVDNAEVRVFDMRSPAFIAAWGSNPSSTRYKDIFDRAESALCDRDSRGMCTRRDKVNYSAIFNSTAGLVASCTTDATGTCIAGENSTGYYLVISKFTDDDTNKTIYIGRTKDPGDFKDTNGDRIKDLAYRDFYVTKTIAKNKPISYSACGKITVTGSLLEIIKPDYTIWENTQELYPFIFKSDSNWTVDLCLNMPAGYQIAEIMDEEGNFMPLTNCTQAFVENETKTLLFTILETGSPEPDVSAELTLTNPHGVASVVSLDIPGRRVQAPFDMMLAALLIGTAIIVAIVINLVMMKGKKKK
jgi:hypothetical protein